MLTPSICSQVHVLTAVVTEGTHQLEGTETGAGDRPGIRQLKAGGMKASRRDGGEG